MFLIKTKPYFEFSVSLVARYMSNPSIIHIKVAKRILRYVKGIINFGIHYACNYKLKLIGFSDSNWGSDLDDRKRTSANCFSL